MNNTKIDWNKFVYREKKNIPLNNIIHKLYEQFVENQERNDEIYAFFNTLPIEKNEEEKIEEQ